jgi:hypothetical protein
MLTILDTRGQHTPPRSQSVTIWVSAKKAFSMVATSARNRGMTGRVRRMQRAALTDRRMNAAML